MAKATTHLKFGILILLVSASIICGKAQYVSPSGANSNPGTLAKPWQSIAFATCGGTAGCKVSSTNPSPIKAGDTLYLRGGEYHENDIRIGNSGTTAAPIVIRSYPGEMATINGDTAMGIGNLGGIFNLGLGGPDSNIVIDSIRFINAYRTSIWLGSDYPTKNITISNCRFEYLKQRISPDNSACVMINESARGKIIIRGCTMIGRGTDNLNYCGILIFYGDGNYEIYNNDISLFSSGIFYKHRGTAQYQCQIHDNYIHGCKTSALMLSTDRIYAYNNLIVNIPPSNQESVYGINIWEDAGGTGGSNCRIEHNTIYNFTNSIVINWGGQLGMSGEQGAMADTLINNITAGVNNELGEAAIWPHINLGGATQGLVHKTISNYNSYFNTDGTTIFREFDQTYSLSQWKAHAPTQDKNSIQESPRFANYSKRFTSIEDFEIIGGGALKGASDGRDMGADVYRISKAKPLITSQSKAFGIKDLAFSYAIIASCKPTRFSSSALPKGLILDTILGKITGTPTDTGIFVITTSAYNRNGASAPFALTIKITQSTVPVIIGKPMVIAPLGNFFFIRLRQSATRFHTQHQIHLLA